MPMAAAELSRDGGSRQGWRELADWPFSEADLCDLLLFPC